jgi:hypothetical protein
MPDDVGQFVGQYVANPVFDHRRDRGFQMIELVA